jgi:K+-sensing histidine kinase KdpD
MSEDTRETRRRDEDAAAAARKTFSHLVRHTLGGAVHSVDTSLVLLSDEDCFGPLNPRQRVLLATATGAATQLRQLTADIALLTAAEANAVNVSRSMLPVNRLLREAIAQAQTPHAPDPAREITVHATPALPPLQCDGTLTRRALAALIENALRFSPSAAPIEVEAHKRRGRLRLIVRDGGAGVISARARKPFDPFGERVEPLNHVGVGLGFGLGLAVAEAAVRAHGGAITLDQTDGRGTQFSIELPFD